MQKLIKIYQKMYKIVILISIVSVLYGLSSEASIDCRTQYHRSCFKHWIDSDNDCLDTRQEVLQRESQIPIEVENNNGKCKIISGQWYDIYSGKTYTNPLILDIDHIIPLKEAWRSGANKWTEQKRQKFANDYDNLIAVHRSLNRQKKDKDPKEWLPPKKDFICEYIELWISIKYKYNLEMDVKEKEIIAEIQDKC